MRPLGARSVGNNVDSRVVLASSGRIGGAGYWFGQLPIRTNGSAEAGPKSAAPCAEQGRLILVPVIPFSPLVNLVCVCWLTAKCSWLDCLVFKRAKPIARLECGVSGYLQTHKRLN